MAIAYASTKNKKPKVSGGSHERMTRLSLELGSDCSTPPANLRRKAADLYHVVVIIEKYYLHINMWNHSVLMPVI